MASGYGLVVAVMAMESSSLLYPVAFSWGALAWARHCVLSFFAESSFWLLF